MTTLNTNEAEAAGERGSIIVLCRDVFFLVTVRNTLLRLGYEPHVAKAAAEFTSAQVTAPLVLVIADMGAVMSTEEWLVLRRSAGEVPILAFGPHKDVDAFRAARVAGVTRVVANSQFHRDMVDLVTRYALPIQSGRGGVE